DGGSSLDAVAAAVATLEDSGVFNAGRGAAPNGDGEIELDAGIMDGATLRAGGVAAVRRIKNPVAAAREVMEHGRHVLLAGAGAAALAQVARLGGRGGLIAVDRRGRIAMPFNSEGMYRGCIDLRGRCMIAANNERDPA